MGLNIKYLIPFGSMISPLLISSYLVFDSFFNGNIKGIVYLFGVIIASFLGIIARPSLGSITPAISWNGKTDVCNMFGFGDQYNKYSSPDFNTLFLSFTMMYVILNMFLLGTYNFLTLLLFMLMIAVNCFYRIKLYCSHGPDILAGLLFGSILGIIWFFLVKFIQDENGMDLLYFQDDKSTKKKCKVSRTKFKCKQKASF
tara:strand:+ start:229 stop:828 length:600 start_codon:yes stop_codon:yes gene_type:complete